MKFITIVALIGFTSNALAAAVPASIGQVDEEHIESNFLRGSTSIVCGDITLSDPNGCGCPPYGQTRVALSCPNQGPHNQATVCCTGPGVSWVQCSEFGCMGSGSGGRGSRGRGWGWGPSDLEEEDYSNVDVEADEPEEDAMAMLES